MGSGIPLGNTSTRLVYTAMDEIVVQDSTRKHDSACVSTRLGYTNMGVDGVGDSTRKHEYSSCIYSYG